MQGNNKTKVVVLKRFPYGESSFIVHTLNQQGARQAFIVSGIGGKRSRFKTNMFQCLQLLDVVFYQSRNDLHRLKEANPSEFTHNITTDIVKNTIAQFVAEIIYKLSKNGDFDLKLFEFIEHSVLFLDNCSRGNVNFHIVFLINFAKHIGIFPQKNFNETNIYFDFNSGYFSGTQTNDSLNKEQSELFFESLNYSFSNFETIEMMNSTRKQLLKLWLHLYDCHFNNFSKLESVEILEAVFN